MSERCAASSASFLAVATSWAVIGRVSHADFTATSAEDTFITLTVTPHSTGDFTVYGSVQGAVADPDPTYNSSSVTGQAVTARAASLAWAAR